VLVNRHKPEPKTDNQLVCYAVEARASDATKPEFVISTDPEDPIFYSSCYVRERNIEWVAPVVPPPPPPLPQSHFSNMCLDCASFETNRQPSNSMMVPPVWTVSKHCTSCDGNVKTDLIEDNNNAKDVEDDCPTTSTTATTTSTTTYTGTTIVTTPPSITTTATDTTTTIYNVANVNCVEEQSPCTAACEVGSQRNYTMIQVSEAKGRACVGPTDCKPGNGLCPLPPPNDVGNGGNGVGSFPSTVRRHSGAETFIPILMCLVFVAVVFRKKLHASFTERYAAFKNDDSGSNVDGATVANEMYEGAGDEEVAVPTAAASLVPEEVLAASVVAAVAFTAEAVADDGSGTDSNAAAATAAAASLKPLMAAPAVVTAAAAAADAPEIIRPLSGHDLDDDELGLLDAYEI